MDSEEDRRVAERHEAIVVVQLDDEGRFGVTRDVSEKGLLIATRTRFAPGDRVEITVRGTSGAMKTIARVVRVEETPRTEPWPFRVAMELDDPIPSTFVKDGARAAAILVRKE